jgi:hemoglobin
MGHHRFHFLKLRNAGLRSVAPFRRRQAWTRRCWNSWYVYAAARRDAVLGSAFDGVGDWEKHIAKITAFWSSVALMTGRYHGQPLAAHFPLGLQPPHFVRWLALFEETTREVCTAAGAGHLMEKAHRIARSLELGMAAHRGELPFRIGLRP